MKRDTHFISCGGASIVIDGAGNAQPSMMAFEKIARRIKGRAKSPQAR